MHRLKRIYLILTYMFFIYPPFIAGLVLIYNDTGDNIEFTSFLINLILLIVLAGVITLAVAYKKIHRPSTEEIKFLIFGFVGNIVMYFYTFQNMLHIENFVTIYLVLLIVLGVHFFLISKRFQPLELWILLPIFLFYDSLFFWLTGCGYASDWGCTQTTDYFSLLLPLFFIIIIFIMLFYMYKILVYKLFDFFKIINIILSIIISFIAVNDFVANEKFTLTIVILLPFFLIVDFIISIVNKTFKKQMYLFYIRTTTCIFISIIIGTSGIIYRSNFDVELLSIFVVVTYVSLFISVLKTVLKIEVKDVKVKDLFMPNSLNVKYVACTIDDLQQIENFFLHYQGEIVPNEQGYHLKVIQDKEIIGVLHSAIEELAIKQKTLQAKIYFIKTTSDFTKHANELLYKLERYYKSKGINYVKYLAESNEEELIQLLLKRGYFPVDVKDDFFYFIKTL